MRPVLGLAMQIKERIERPGGQFFSVGNRQARQADLLTC
jgi:hypothetical protein